MPKLLLVLLCALAVLLIVGMGSWHYIDKYHTIHQGYGSTYYQFTLNLPYDVVRKSMVRGDLLQAVVRAQGGRVVAQNVIDSKFQVQSLRPTQWTLNAISVAYVEIQHERLAFKQHAHVTDQSMVTTAELLQPTPRLMQCRHDMRVYPIDGNRTCVFLSFQAWVRVTAPLVSQEYVNQQVTSRLEQQAVITERVMRQEVDKFIQTSKTLPWESFVQNFLSNRIRRDGRAVDRR